MPLRRATQELRTHFICSQHHTPRRSLCKWVIMLGGDPNLHNLLGDLPEISWSAPKFPGRRSFSFLFVRCKLGIVKAVLLEFLFFLVDQAEGHFRIRFAHVEGEFTKGDQTAPVAKELC